MRCGTGKWGVPSAPVYAPTDRSYRRTCCDRLLGGGSGASRHASDAWLLQGVALRHAAAPALSAGRGTRVRLRVRRRRRPAQAFAGLFAVAPSIAIATRALTASTPGAEVAAIEQRSALSCGDERSGGAPGALRRATARDETAFGAPAPRSEARKWSLPAPAVTIEMGDGTDRG